MSPPKEQQKEMEAAIKTFFSSQRFAVAGASSDPNKFGHKVFTWYLSHSLPATPLNPRCDSITAANSTYTTTSSPSFLSDPTTYSLSVITPPSITKPLLEEAKKVGIASIWLQPGTFDVQILDWARKEWPGAAIGGDDVPGSRGGEGWCVLVDGERGLRGVGKL